MFGTCIIHFALLYTSYRQIAFGIDLLAETDTNHVRMHHIILLNSIFKGV
jgi:hypothetical protein